jgi:hypothetical protein
LQELQQKNDTQSAEQKENYEALKPVWFEHASQKAKKYRKKLVDAKNVEQMKHLQKILVYNDDKKTIRLPEIDETFCSDLVWWNSMNRNDSMNLAKSKWYHLLSDWNDCDSEIDKKKSDWWRLENTFWKYANQWALFSMLDFDNDRYWTATPYKDEKWKIVSGVVRDRTLGENDCNRGWYYTSYDGRVCGFKDSM